jgi:hypothetical protein
MLKASNLMLNYHFFNAFFVVALKQTKTLINSGLHKFIYFKSKNLNTQLSLI